MSPAALFNGRPVPDLSTHRALHYGDGVFRTCFIYNSQVVDLHDQCELTIHDATRLGLTPVAPDQLASEARQVAAGIDKGVLKILLLRGGEARGYRPRDAATDRLLLRYDARPHPASRWEDGVSVGRSPLRLSAQPALAGIKHLNRLEQVLASRDWDEGTDEVLMADDADRPVCGTRTNLFWIKGAVLQTPPLDRCGVAGHMRRKVLALAPSLGFECRVAHGQWDELEAADEVFLTNSLIGIWPVARLAARRWGAPGAATRRLMDRLAHPRCLLTGRAA